MSYLFGTAVFGGLLFIFALWAFRQWKLAKEGVLTQARVIRKVKPFGKSLGPISSVIEYDFLTPKGEFSRNSVFVGEAVSHVHKEGSEIEVVYLKGNPSVNGTKHHVNKSRRFFNMPPL